MGTSASIYEKKINLKGKGIRNLEADLKRYDMIRSWKTPKSINLSKNKIVVISPIICEEVSKLQNVQDHLTEINLSRNKVKVIPGAFLMLVNIEILKLSYNEIELIPTKLADCLYNLKELKLNHNKIKEIPWNFNKLHQLKTLFLNNNEISYVPNTIGELNLDELSLHENQLNPLLFDSNTVEGILTAIMNQKIPKEYRDQVQKLIEEWEAEGKGKSELERKFLFFLQQDAFREDFFNFLKKENSHENLDFWQRVDRLKWKYYSIYEVKSLQLT